MKACIVVILKSPNKECAISYTKQNFMNANVSLGLLDVYIHDG